ncbi:hypothetical protein L5G28_16160 [Gordonia sp. HY285]|uniref:hypothetical protein n=1 Tax=Gordonia liuliyuniae TaxID=2911517 RepID=UPI001F17001D|nr:hypothetical protein [Gordonia liuliyuniae]MCF8611680.1 hypothetical protein [Gordonia liuliyuniae]
MNAARTFSRSLQVAKFTGSSAWWVFVVAQLMAELAMPPSGAPVRYSDASYTPMTSVSDVTGDLFTTSNTLASISIAALAVTVIAALAHAVIVRRLFACVVIVIAPIVGGALILWTLDSGVGDSPRLSTFAAFALVLLGVAIREIGSRITTYVHG